MSAIKPTPYQPSQFTWCRADYSQEKEVWLCYYTEGSESEMLWNGQPLFQPCADIWTDINQEEFI